MSTVTPKSSSNPELAEQFRAQQEQKDRLRAEHEEEMNRLEKAFETEKSHTRDRFESQINAERIQSYENLKNYKRQANSEQKRFEDASQQNIQNKRDQFVKEELRVEREGQAQVDQTRKRMAAAEEYQRNQANSADKLARTNYGKNAQTIMKDFEGKVNQLQEEKSNLLEQRKTEHGVAVQQIKDHYDSRQFNVHKQHLNETKRLEDGATKQIDATRVAQAERVATHAAKQSDPFYRLARIDSNFEDVGENYVLKVRLPEHERKGFRVQISGQELQLSGTRSSIEKAEVEPGHSVDTKSYQNYSERYKFDTPVDARGMRVQATDYGFEYTIPKFGKNYRMEDSRDLHKKKFRAEDLALDETVEYKNTLPLPTIPEDKGSGTVS